MDRDRQSPELQGWTFAQRGMSFLAWQDLNSPRGCWSCCVSTPRTSSGLCSTMMPDPNYNFADKLITNPSLLLILQHFHSFPNLSCCFFSQVHSMPADEGEHPFQELHVCAKKQILSGPRLTRPACGVKTMFLSLSYTQVEGQTSQDCDDGV